jgi:hypothetical protein
MARSDCRSLIVGFGHPERERIEFVFSDSEVERFRSSGEDWLQAHCTVVAGTFQGEADLWFESADFARVLPPLRQLYETLQGAVDFHTIEDQVGFCLTGDGRGHIELRGYLLDRAGGGNRLEFALNYDQTLLWHSISEIDELLTFLMERRAEL